MGKKCIKQALAFADSKYNKDSAHHAVAVEAFKVAWNNARQAYGQTIYRLEKELAEAREEYDALRGICFGRPTSELIITEFHMNPDCKYTTGSGGSGGSGK